MRWNESLRRRLAGDLVDRYNQWAEEHFRPRSDPDQVTNLDTTLFKQDLQQADWNKDNEASRRISPVMLYGATLPNKGLFGLGTYKGFWLVLRLNMWAITPRKIKFDSIDYRTARGPGGGILRLTYDAVGDDLSPAELLCFPLCKQTHLPTVVR